MATNYGFTDEQLGKLVKRTVDCGYRPLKGKDYLAIRISALAKLADTPDETRFRRHLDAWARRHHAFSKLRFGGRGSEDLALIEWEKGKPVTVAELKHIFRTLNCTGG